MTAVRTQVEDAVLAGLLPLKLPQLGGGAAGYLACLEPYGGQLDGSADLEQVEALLAGRFPGVLVYTDDGRYDSPALNLRRVTEEFAVVLVVLSDNLRDLQRRARGEISANPAAGKDPGIYQMLDDLLKALLGRDFGVVGMKGLVPRQSELLFFTPRCTAWRMRFDVRFVRTVDEPGEAAAPAITEVVGRTSLVDVNTVVKSGTGDSFTFAVNVVTLTDAGGGFGAEFIGKTITITGATSPANNGSWLITGVPGATQLQWMNPAGVAEAYAGAWTVRGAPLVTQQTTVP